MIKFLANRMANVMQDRYDYDGSYLQEVASVSRGGALRLGVLLPMLSGYSDGCPVDLWAGAAVASARDGDCGPCLQLVIDMAIERGADPEALRKTLQDDPRAAGTTGLGYRFGLAAITNGDELEDLRAEISETFSDRAVVSLSITAATSRAWSVVKRGLGHAHTCQAVKIKRETVNLARIEGQAAC